MEVHVCKSETAPQTMIKLKAISSSIYNSSPWPQDTCNGITNAMPGGGGRERGEGREERGEEERGIEWVSVCFGVQWGNLLAVGMRRLCCSSDLFLLGQVGRVIIHIADHFCKREPSRMTIAPWQGHTLPQHRRGSHRQKALSTVSKLVLCYFSMPLAIITYLLQVIGVPAKDLRWKCAMSTWSNEHRNTTIDLEMGHRENCNK